MRRFIIQALPNIHLTVDLSGGCFVASTAGTLFAILTWLYCTNSEVSSCANKSGGHGLEVFSSPLRQKLLGNGIPFKLRNYQELFLSFIPTKVEDIEEQNGTSKFGFLWATSCICRPLFENNTKTSQTHFHISTFHLSSNFFPPVHSPPMSD